jgi:hypothetical protein
MPYDDSSITAVSSSVPRREAKAVWRTGDNAMLINMLLEAKQ